jgi:hypothetical protein
VSECALEHLKKGKWDSNTLQYDHMIPKTKYITKVCEDAAKNSIVTSDYVFDVLMRNLWTATIHNQENKHLGKLGLRNTMPRDWDGVNIFARYQKADIKLMAHERAICTFLNEKD